MTSFRAHSLAAAIALATAGLPMMANAAAPGPDASPDFAQVAVQSGDLDLTTASGVAALQQRIRAASRTACRAANPEADVRSDQIRECRIEAIRNARDSVESLVTLARAGQAISVEASAVPR